VSDGRGPLRVGVNALALEPGRPSGARERLAEGTGGAARLLEEKAEFYVYVPRGLLSDDLGALGAAANARVVEAPIPPGRGLARRLRALRFLAARAEGDALDVLETSPLLVPRILPPRTRVVVTVHDLRAFGSVSPGAILRRIAARRGLARGEVVAVSRFTAGEVRRNAGVEAHVIENGVREVFFEPLPEADVGLSWAREPLVLWVGHLERRKDPVTMARAFALLGRDLSLVMVGAEAGAGRALRRAIAAAPNRERIVIAPPQPLDALRALYRRARVFVVTSRYEGFSLPVLEAMASGTPVVASLAGAIPEVAGDAAHYAPPGDAAAFAGAVNRVLLDGPVRAAIVEAGIARARAFPWARASAALAALYERTT